MTVDEEQCLERHGQNGHKLSYSKGGFPTHPSFSLETTNFARAERPHDSKPPSLPGHLRPIVRRGFGIPENGKGRYSETDSAGGAIAA